MRGCDVNLIPPSLTWPLLHPLPKRSSSRLSATLILSQEKARAGVFLQSPNHSRVEIPRCGFSHHVLACLAVRTDIGPCRDRLNTLLELRIENERLQQHIRALRAHSQQISAGQVTQHLGSYAVDDMSAQLAVNLGLPARSTLSADSSRPHYPSIPHVYEAGGCPAITMLDDDGDSEPRRKKAILLATQSAHFTDTFILSPAKKIIWR